MRQNLSSNHDCNHTNVTNITMLIFLYTLAVPINFKGHRNGQMSSHGYFSLLLKQNSLSYHQNHSHILTKSCIFTNTLMPVFLNTPGSHKKQFWRPQRFTDKMFFFFLIIPSNFILLLEPYKHSIKTPFISNPAS